MPTEAQKIKQAYRDGVQFGAVAGAEKIKQDVLALLADIPDAADRLKQIDPSNVKVKT